MYDFPSEGSAPLLSAPRLSGSLTYEAFYGLNEKAFSLSADPRFLYRSPAHGPAYDALLSGIRRREGLVVLSGEIGTGKTTLCRSVLANLDRRTFSSFVADPFVSREDLLKTLLVENVSLPPAVEEALDKRTSMGVIGDLSKYMQYQSATAIGDAAKNPGGGGAAAAGIGAGVRGGCATRPKCRDRRQERW